MRIINQNGFNENNFIKLKDQNWLNKQRLAGKYTAQTLSLLQNLVKEKTTKSLLELDAIAEEFILRSNGTPTFKNYKGFPGSVCISVNKQLVHGIPTDYKLQDGDIVSFDLGVTYEHAIADSALTCIYGEPKSELHVKLIKATEESLMKGIAAIAVGKRLGCIGNAIYKSAKGNGFQVINNYGGHGISWDKPHDAPFVENKSDPDKGPRIQAGLSIAIEPMLVLGSVETKVLSDGWTVVTDNLSSHCEHSVFVHPDHVEIITAR